MKWIKRQKPALPEEHICRNCGTQTVGKYCHECGQDVFSGTEQPIVHLFGQMLENAFALDSKLPRTLAFLMYRPGFLSTEFRAGRISKYVHPVKLFWMATLLFFALVIFQFSNITQNDSEEVTAKHSTINISLGSSSETINLSSDNEEEAQEIIEFKDKMYNLILNALSNYAPYVTFLLIPIFALVLMLFFWRKKYYYIHHLIFTVHFHTFLWIFCSLLMIIKIFTHNWKFPDWLGFLIFITPGVYLSIAFHRFYLAISRWQAVWKAILITFLYFILILTVVILLVIFMTKSVLFPGLL
jgi:hypothetical protein